MCGIIGFTGNLQAPGILVDGLQQLEYRGYDSAGIAVNNGSETKIVKTTGKVATLREKVEATADLAGTCGIGHTRWATHGGVTEVNAHPHVSGNVTLIHNGIIENYKELAASLKTKGFTAISETDTEVAAMLIDSLYDGDPFAALKEADKALEGAYGFCVMFKDHPGEIYCMRNASPLVASHTEDGSFIASDMVALLKYTKDYFVVPEEHIVVMKADSITYTQWMVGLKNLRCFMLTGIQQLPRKADMISLCRKRSMISQRLFIIQSCLVSIMVTLTLVQITSLMISLKV